MKDLYSNMTAKVKWDGFLSSPVSIRQGVRQGGILSAPHYKRYNNSFLIDVEDRFCGKRIGTVSIPHVTVADDMCFITEEEPEIQPIMSATELQANREHYTIHPTKTVILNYNDQLQPSVFLYGTTVTAEDQTVHLDVHRHINCTPNTDEKINLGRRTAYSLMGAGFHGKSGLIWSITEKSWFPSVRMVLNAYSLPSAYELLNNPPSKEQWKKKTVENKVHHTIEQQWRDDIETKSSLKYLNPNAVRVGKVHQVYAFVRNNVHDVRRAEVKARLLTGTYTLQSNMAKFNQFNVSPIC